MCRRSQGKASKISAYPRNGGLTGRDALCTHSTHTFTGIVPTSLSHRLIIHVLIVDIRVLVVDYHLAPSLYLFRHLFLRLHLFSGEVERCLARRLKFTRTALPGRMRIHSVLQKRRRLTHTVLLLQFVGTPLDLQIFDLSLELFDRLC